MKTTSFFTTMVLAACCLGSVILASCSKEEDNKKPTNLRFSAMKVEVAPGATSTVTITNGAQPYIAKSADEKTATVKANKNILTVTGVKEGKTTIVVTDKNKQSGTLAVNVVAPLSFDKPAVNVGVGKEEIVTVKSGKAPYTVTVKDQKVATATVKDSKVTIKGVKAGTTTVTVLDKAKLAGVITVTVK